MAIIPSPENCHNKPYNKFRTIRGAAQEIVNFLFDYAPNLWKLLKYGTKDSLSKPDLTTDEKAAMICVDSSVDGSTAQKNVLMQLDVEDGLTLAINQIRIDLGNVKTSTAQTGTVYIHIQVIVPIKQISVSSPYSEFDNRAVAIVQELANALNGTRLNSFSSVMFLDEQGDGGRSTGIYRQPQNKGYTGYMMIFGALCS